MKKIPPNVVKAISLLIALAFVNFLNSFILNGQIRLLGIIEILSLIIQFILIGGIIYLLYKRKNWTRYLLLYPFYIMTIFLPFRIGVLLKENLHNGLSIIVSYVAEAIALILLFSKESNEWYKPKK